MSEPPAENAEGQTTTVKEVIAQVQRLCNTPKPEGGYPLATYVEGYFLGDITAIVAAKIRSERLREP